MDGVFPILVVAGLFLLIIAVVIGTVVLVRRDRSADSAPQQPRPATDAGAAEPQEAPASRPIGQTGETPDALVGELGAARPQRWRSIGTG